MRMLFPLVTIVFLSLAAGVFADDSKQKTPARSPNAAGAGKSIKFDDDVVEGMDKQRLDSLTAKLGRDDDDGRHLYKKRSSFKVQDQQVLKELVHWP